jgi:3-oxoacyl-[acyl-carrier protein] reductase
MDLRDRVVLITGGGTGLGKAISTQIARDGAIVAIGYRSSAGAAQGVVEQLRSGGHEAAAYQVDVGDWAQAADLVNRVYAELGPIDVLINNAGVTRAVPASRIDLVTHEDWDRILRVNVIGAFACSQAVLPGMIERGCGRIVNVASDSAFSSTGSSIPYVVSKAALVSLTKALAQAVGPDVLVNAIAPGWMDTPWLERNLPPSDAKVVREGPLLSPESVASAAIALVKDDAARGRVVRLDAGSSAVTA